MRTVITKEQEDGLSFRVVQINGPDKGGIFVEFCKYFADNNINILDISQNVLRGYLSITFLLDIKDSAINEDRIALGLKQIGRKKDCIVKVNDYRVGQRARVRDLYVLTIIGEDKIGLLYNVSSILHKHRVNIETIQVKVNQKLIYNQFVTDCGEVQSISLLRNELRHLCETLNLSMTLQKEQTFRKNKRLIIFDMDSTLIDGETIVEIAKLLGKEDEMAKTTEIAMSGNSNFSESLKYRAKLIAGVPESDLKKLADNIEIMQGVEELISELKDMGWKIGVVSSGFSYFTDSVKDKLGLDYSFGNTLEIKNGVATGKVVGEIIDSEGKWEIVKELAEQLGLKTDQIVTIGDGSNDISMIKNSGLGFGFNSKEILSEVADGKIEKNHLLTLLLMIGLSETEIDKLFFADKMTSDV